jgi:hypothetical protein
LDLVLEVLYAPLYQRWLLRTGPLTESYADALVATALKAFRPWPKYTRWEDLSRQAPG